jgi:hypothetical protein
VSSTAFTIQDQVAAADVQFLDEQINAYNVARTGIDDARLLVAFVRDERGAIAAGVFGWTWGGCCEINYLWVAEALRGLLVAAEQEAAARGCELLMLDTHSFQAPQFYQQRGYEIVGEVAGYPRGYSKFYLKKALAERRGSRVPDSEQS